MHAQPIEFDTRLLGSVASAQRSANIRPPPSAATLPTRTAVAI
jgi:hypothetical protein